MSRTYHDGERSIRVRGVRKDPIDLRRLARALIALAQAQAEADAQAADTSMTSAGKSTTDNGKISANTNITPTVIGISATDDRDAA